MGGIHSIQDWTATTSHGGTRKRSTKGLEHTGKNLFRKNLQLKDVAVNSRPKSTKIIGERKAFYR